MTTEITNPLPTLSHPQLSLWNAIAASPSGWGSASEWGDAEGYSATAARRHLTALEDLGLVMAADLRPHHGGRPRRIYADIDRHPDALGTASHSGAHDRSDVRAWPFDSTVCPPPRRQRSDAERRALTLLLDAIASGEVRLVLNR